MGATGYRLRAWLRARWRSAVALTLLVALAGGASLTLVAGARRTLTAPERYVASFGGIYDIEIQQAFGPPRLDELEGLDATDEVAAATFVFGGLLAPASEAPVDTLVFAGNTAALGTRLTEGREPDEPGEFVATQLFVEANDAKVGDEYDVITFTQAQADEFGFNAPQPKGPSLRATLVGVVETLGDLNEAYAMVLFPARLLDRGDVGVAATIGLASLSAGSSLDDLRAELDELPDGEVFSLRDADLVSSEIRAAVSAQGQGLLILGAIVAITALVVLGQLLTRQLRLEANEGDALLALGAGPGHSMVEPTLRAALVVPVGAVFAAILAWLFSGTFPIDFVRRVEPDVGLRLDPLVLGVGALLLTGLLVAWVRIAVAAETRRSVPPSRVTVAERLAAAVPSGQMSTALRFAFTSTAGGGRRTGSSILGLALVCGVLVAALTFGANLSHLVDERALYGVNFDIAIGAGEAEVSGDVVDALEESADVGGLTLYGVTAVAIGSASLDVVGMDPVRGELVADTRSGRLPVTDDEIALGAVAARELDVDVGDSLRVEGAGGARTLRVTGLAVVPPIGGADGVGRSALVTEQGFVALDPDAGMNTAVVRFDPAAPPGAMDRIGELVPGDVGPTDTPASIANLERVRSIPLLVVVAVGVLALLSLGHLMLLSVRRRRLDHAVLRAIGATPRWLAGVVHWQATLATAAIILVATPLGVALGRTLYGRLVDDVGARTDVVLPIAWIAATAAILVVLANLVTAIPARQSRRSSPTRLLTRS